MPDTTRDIEAEWRHLWAWVREHSHIRDLPAEMKWEAGEERLRYRDPSGVSVRFNVQVIRAGLRREVAEVQFHHGSVVVTETMVIPPDVSEAALAAGRQPAEEAQP